MSTIEIPPLLPQSQPDASECDPGRNPSRRGGHLKVRINKVARDAGGALDPKEFWRAWAAGAAAAVDTFSLDWNFWAYVEEPLAALRERWSIFGAGL